MKATRIIYTIAVCGGAFLLLGCDSGANGIKEVNSEALRKNLAPTEVDIVEAIIKPFDYQIHTNGVVVPEKEIGIVFKSAGFVDKYYIHQGEKVKKGQMLAVLSNDEEALALEKAQIQLRERQLEYESQILGSGGRGDSVLVASLRENLAFVSGLRAAEIEYKQAEYRFNHTFLKAPISGILSNLQGAQGSTVAKGDNLCTIYSSTTLLVETEVLESVIGKVKIGQKVEIIPLAISKKYDGVIRSINPWVSEHGTVSLTIKISSSRGLLPGMNVALTISAPYNKNVIIPETALVIRSGKEVVFVEEDGLAKWHYITTGLKSNNEVEVLTGLKEGDKVIITNNIYLAHDAPVKPKTTENY